MRFHSKPKWTSRLSANIFLLLHCRPKWTLWLLGTILFLVGSFCLLLGWWVVQSERRLAEEEWEAIRSMHEFMKPVSPGMATPPTNESKSR